jgi:hypothetical protein
VRHLPWIFLALIAACGGGSVAQNIPAPNKAAAAGVTAGAAAALTLADPRAAAATAESAKTTDEKKPQKSGGTVPADVFDRLDAKKPVPEQEQQQPPVGGEP